MVDKIVCKRVYRYVISTICVYDIRVSSIKSFDIGTERKLCLDDTDVHLDNGGREGGIRCTHFRDETPIVPVS